MPSTVKFWGTRKSVFVKMEEKLLVWISDQKGKKIM